jgi:hypothetical protein
MAMTDNEPDTELTPTANAPEVAQAWSVDDDAAADEHLTDEEEQPRRHGLAVSLGLVALVAGVIGCVLLLATAFFSWHTSKQAVPSHVPTPPTTTPAAVVSAPAPPTTVTVQAAPPNTGLPTPGPSVYDLTFLSLMAQEGWGCTDNSDAQQCKREMVSFAHQACSYSGLDYSVVYQNMAGSSFISPARETRRALANASQAYPNCTFTGTP